MRKLQLSFAFVGFAVRRGSATVTAAQNAATRRLVALGDVHGDYDKASAALIHAGLMHPRTGAWSGGETTLVQTGDLVDRGHQDKEVLDLFMRLEQEALAVGGKVVVLVGNHEDMVIHGREDYVAKQSLPAFGGVQARRESMSAKGRYGKWIRGLPLVYRDMRTVFIHAFLEPGLANPEFLVYCSDLLQKHCSKASFLSSPPPPAIEGKQVIPPEGIIGGVNHIYSAFVANRSEVEAAWRRGGVPEARDLCAAIEATIHECFWRRPKTARRDVDDLTTALRLTDADRMVVGHTPSSDGRITKHYDDRLVVIDVGMSRWMRDQPPKLLEFIESGLTVTIEELTAK